MCRYAASDRHATIFWFDGARPSVIVTMRTAIVSSGLLLSKLAIRWQTHIDLTVKDNLVVAVSRLSAFTIIVILCRFAYCGEHGLVAHYKFDEGQGIVAHDASGGRNDGSIVEAVYVPGKKGYSLKFDGKRAFIKGGRGQSFSLTNQITVEAWINPERPSTGESGIVGCGSSYDSSWGITYSESSRCYFYLSAGANNCSAELTSESWHYIAATFDGTKMLLYIDGKEVASKAIDLKQINSGDDLLIGKNGAVHFNGMIDNVRIHNRALSADAIRAEYEAGIDDTVGVLAPLVARQVIQNDEFTVNIGPGGAMEVVIGTERYRVDSTFSYQGEHIGHNALSESAKGSETSWKPAFTKSSNTAVRVTASGKSYALDRVVVLDDGKIHVSDTLTNVDREPVAIIVEHRVLGANRLRDIYLSGGIIPSVAKVAENPSIFLSQDLTSLGVLAEDNLFRLQFEAAASTDQISFAAKHFALDADAKYTFRWTIYPFARRADYFDLVNQIRRDWNSNYTIQGPFDWVDARNVDLLENPARLNAFLKRRKLKIVGLLPYLSYFSGASLSREQFKSLIRKANAALKQVDPEILCLGSIENNIVAFDRAKLSRGDMLDDVCRGTGAYPLALSEGHTRMLLSDLPWKDSLVLDRQGRAMIEDCKPSAFVHPMVYSAPGNYHTSYLMDQAKFLIEDVGLDGVYMDHFNMAFEDQQRHDYSKWDGYTVDINPSTAQITRKYTDAGLVGIKPREELSRYILSHGKAFVVNTQNVANETQAIPIMHFEEVGSNADLNALKPGEEPPLIQYIAKLQLGSPIGLGLPSSDKKHPEIQHIDEVMKTLILYLRHGLLFYHNQTLVPETGAGSGEYGPINHMFPITPIELNKGWIRGKERIITAVSGTFPWTHAAKPQVLCFDRTGRTIQADWTVTGTKGDWQIQVRLQNWQNVAVIE
jgi:hypothetical protein